jgi:hypothetical protein
MHEALLQRLALLCSLCGKGSLALAMDAHWEQVSCGSPRRAHCSCCAPSP